MRLSGFIDPMKLQSAEAGVGVDVELLNLSTLLAYRQSLRSSLQPINRRSISGSPLVAQRILPSASSRQKRPLRQCLLPSDSPPCAQCDPMSHGRNSPIPASASCSLWRATALLWIQYRLPEVVLRITASLTLQSLVTVFSSCTLSTDINTIIISAAIQEQ